MECKLDNITVHYEMFGEGRPIVMLHGWPLDHRHMVSDMEPLFRGRGGWRRIYPDLPGMGKTSGADWITHQDQMLEIVLGFIDAVIPKQRFVAAGNSYGGYVARGLVYRKADLMDGVFIMVPVIVADGAKRTLPPRVTLVEDAALMAELAPDEVEAHKGITVVQSRQMVDFFRSDIIPAVEAADQKFLNKLSENYAFSFDVDALQEPFDKPALLLMGRQDSVCGYRDAWSIFENYPRGTFVVLDRAGHVLGVEQRELFNALANEWLDRVEESAD